MDKIPTGLLDTLTPMMISRIYLTNIPILAIGVLSTLQGQHEITSMEQILAKARKVQAVVLEAKQRHSATTKRVNDDLLDQLFAVRQK